MSKKQILNDVPEMTKMFAKAEEIASLYGAEVVKIIHGKERWTGVLIENGEEFTVDLGPILNPWPTASIKTISCLEEARATDISDYIYNNLGKKSKRTGKPVHINTFHWTKSQLIRLVRNAGFEEHALTWLNEHC